LAQWWELAIPASSALLGLAIGSGSQLAAQKSQARHEKGLKTLDEKRNAYVQYSRHMRRFGKIFSDQAKNRTTDNPQGIAEEIQTLGPLVQDSFGVISMLGATPVFSAASAMLDYAYSGDYDDEKWMTLERRFESAARADLGTR
jgi:hypothetical protein